MHDIVQALQSNYVQEKQLATDIESQYRNQPSGGRVWTLDDLGDLLNTLHPVAHKSIDFGIQLGVPDHKLQEIEEQHTNPSKQLREILRYRLRQAPLTLHDIVQALQSNCVQEKQLATDIESQYRNQLSVTASQQVTCTHTPTAPPPHIHHSVSQSTLHPNLTTPNTQPHPHLQPAPYMEVQAFYPQPHPPQHSSSSPPPNPPTSTPSQPQAEAAQPPSSSQPSSSQLMSVPVTSQAMPGPSPQLSQDVATPHPLQIGEQQALQGQPPLQHIPSHQPQTVAQLHDTGSDIGPPHAKRGRHDSWIPQSQDTGSQTLSFQSEMEPMATSLPIPPQAVHLPLYGLQPTPLPHQVMTTNHSRRQLTTNDLPQLLNLLQPVAHKCIFIGLQLGVSDDVIQSIRPPYPDYQIWLYEILRHRLNQTPPLTWHDIGEALQSNSVQEIRLAREIESWYMYAYESSMAQYIAYIKTVYEESVLNELNVVKWPPTPSKAYINLVCVDRTTRVSKQEADECTRAMVCDGSVDVVLGKKTPIDFTDIAKNMPTTKTNNRRVILVEGAPGVGKSTLAGEFCRRWEKGEIGQQYKLVLLLQLRDKEMSEAESLADLLYHPSKTVVRAVEDELIATLGANTLIILEGFDELPSMCRTQSSVFLRLINGTLLPHATVLVTSRPWATQVIHWECGQRIFQHIEILGFTGKQIEEYVTSVFMDEENVANDKAKENIEEVMSYITSFPQIRSCMYIPLNSAIVVSVYQESKAGKCILPKTLTELCYALVQTLLLRYLYGHPEYDQKKWEVQSLKEDLPPDVYSKLLAISELAYSGICNGQKGSVQLIFTNLPPDLETLGLMQSVPHLYVTQPQDMSYNFLHLTVQEFLAALHISNMSPEKHLEHFQEGRGWKKAMWRVVLRFLVGITKLANLSPEDTRALLLEESNIHTNSYRQDVYSVTLDVTISSESVHWMFEAQRDDVVPLVLQERTVEFRGQRGLTSLDYYSLGFCIVHSHCQWVLRIEDDEIGEEEVRMLVAGANTRQDTSARVIGLRGGETEEKDEGGCHWPLSVSAEGLHVLFINLQNVIHLQELHLDLPVECSRVKWPNLSELKVLHLGISGKRNWSLDTVLPHLSLGTLKIESTMDGTLVFEDCVALGMLLSSSDCLKCLHFDQVSIDAQGMESVNKAMSENASLPLRDLIMHCYCTFSDSAANSLALLIRKSTTLHHLSIANCITDTALATLSLALYHNSTLRNLNLSNNDITDAGSAALAQALPYNSVLNKLNLSNNTIGDTGLATLAQALHHNSILDRLDLSNNNVTDAGSAALAQLSTDYPHLRVSDRVFLKKENDVESGNEEGTMDEEKQRQLLNEALEKGYINTGLDVLLFIGAAGSGKSHYKNLCLGLPPPEVRDSTGLSEHPVRTMSHVRGAVKQIPQSGEEPSYQWTEVSDIQLKELIMEAVGEGKVENISDSAVVMNSESKVPEGLPTLDSKHDLDSNPEPLRDIQIDVEHNEPEGLKLHVDQETSENETFTLNERPTLTRNERYKSNLYLELLDAMRKIKSTPSSQRSQVKLLDVNWVYIVDSGGQPQFREMLPLLVQMATACVLTLKLNEPLGELNEVECIEKGKELCRPYLSVLTNEQTVKHCSQIVDSQTEDCALFIVGTHRDLEHHCETESRADKNRMLRKLLEPQLGDKLEKYTDEEVIFPVNSKDPQEGDEEVVQQFRNAVHATSQGSSKEKVKIPLHWFLLELLLRQLAMKNEQSDSKGAENDIRNGIKVDILSFEGCKQEAMNQLKMSEAAFQAAVQFLAKNLGTILYFPDIRELKHIIFTPQALMSILSEIVKIRHRLNNNPWPGMYRRQRKMWSKFKMFGMMDKTLLKSAPLKALFSDVFAPEHFLTLMRELMIAACVSDTTHFFPSVLEELPPGEVQRKTKESCKCLAPLVLYCSSTVVDWMTKENWLPVGSFMSLVVRLLNVNKWTHCTDDKREPTCLYRNCIQLKLPDQQGVVTLVNWFSHVEVYLQVDPETIRTSSKTVGTTVHNELEVVFKHLNYSRNDVKKGFLCPEHNNSHIATLARSDRGQWRCTCKKDCSKSRALTEKQLPWLQDTLGGLAIHDLAELESVLHKVTHKCIAFGLQLGVKENKIQEIKKDNPNQCSDQLRAILSYRLKQLPLLTWRDVIKALESTPVEEKQLASEIESKYTN